MLTRAIVEEVLTPYEVRVRIPLLDRMKDSPMATSFEDLSVATICTLPSCYMNIQVGDIVFVGFEDYVYRKVVILGHLSREACSTLPDIHVNDLIATGNIHLSANTTIGNVSSEQVQMLSGLTANIQKQIDSLKEQIETLRG